MQKISKINTALLFVAIFILFGINWTLWHSYNQNKKSIDSSVSSVDLVTNNQKEQSEQIQDKKNIDSNKTLTDLITNNPNGVIDECNYEGSVYFRLYPNIGIADVPYLIYSSTGKQISSGGGFVRSDYPVDPLFKKINPTCTKQVYIPKSKG